MATSDEVNTFNALPCFPKTPSGLAPNIWHFDLRFVPLSPPAHLLFVFQPESHFVHHEDIPPRAGSKKEDSRLGFFPETATEAAPEICKALIKTFVSGFGMRATDPRIPIVAPFKLVTDDREIAEAVGEEFEKLKVIHKSLWRVGVHKKNKSEIQGPRDYGFAPADEAFEELYTMIKNMMGMDKALVPMLPPPTSIDFSTGKLIPKESEWQKKSQGNSKNRRRQRREKEKEKRKSKGKGKAPVNKSVDSESSDASSTSDAEGDADFQKILAYSGAWRGSDPKTMTGEVNGTAVLQSVEETTTLFKEKPEAVIKKEADAGDAIAQIGYALRLIYHCGLSESKFIPSHKLRQLARSYLIAPLTSKDPSSTPSLKASAHSILITWLLPDQDKDLPYSRPGGVTPRYLISACHHANRACQILKKHNLGFIPGVLWFAQKFQNTQDRLPEMAFYTDVWEAFEKRTEQVMTGREKIEKMVDKMPNRYHCAKEGCSVSSDSGKKLLRCAGKCDDDKKPFYCSKECQRADWKNHKPYCRPNAPSSVALPPHSQVGRPHEKSTSGAIQVPVMGPHGNPMSLSSSTLDAGFLKEIQAESMKDWAKEQRGGEERGRLRPSQSIHQRRMKSE